VRKFGFFPFRGSWYILPAHLEEREPEEGTFGKCYNRFLPADAGNPRHRQANEPHGPERRGGPAGDRKPPAGKNQLLPGTIFFIISGGNA